MPALADLTPREREVLAYVARGYTNDEIGRQMGITAGGVKHHLDHIFEKWDCPDRTSAGALYTRLVTADEYELRLASALRARLVATRRRSHHRMSEGQMELTP